MTKPLGRLNELAGYPDESPKETRHRFVPADPDDIVVHSRKTGGETKHHRPRRLSWLEGKGAEAEDIAPAFFPAESSSIIVKKADLSEDSAYAAECAFDSGTAFTSEPKSPQNKSVQGVTVSEARTAEMRFTPCSRCWGIGEIADALDAGEYNRLTDINGWDARQALPDDHPAWREIVVPFETPHDIVSDTPQEIAHRAVRRERDDEADQPWYQYDTMLALYHRYQLSTERIADLFGSEGRDISPRGIQHGMKRIGVTPRRLPRQMRGLAIQLSWGHEHLSPDEVSVIPYDEVAPDSHESGGFRGVADD